MDMRSPIMILTPCQAEVAFRPGCGTSNCDGFMDWDKKYVVAESQTGEASIARVNEANMKLPSTPRTADSVASITTNDADPRPFSREPSS